MSVIVLVNFLFFVFCFLITYLFGNFDNDVNMFDEKDENLAKFVDAVYFTSQPQQLYQSSLYVHDNSNKIGKIGTPIESKEIDKIYQQLASCKLDFEISFLRLI